MGVTKSLLVKRIWRDTRGQRKYTLILVRRCKCQLKLVRWGFLHSLSCRSCPQCDASFSRVSSKPIPHLDTHRYLFRRMLWGGIRSHGRHRARLLSWPSLNQRCRHNGVIIEPNDSGRIVQQFDANEQSLGEQVMRSRSDVMVERVNSRSIIDICHPTEHVRGELTKGMPV